MIYWKILFLSWPVFCLICMGNVFAQEKAIYTALRIPTYEQILTHYFQLPPVERIGYIGSYFKNEYGIELWIPDFLFTDIATLSNTASINPLTVLDGTFLGWQLNDTARLDSFIKDLQHSLKFQVFLPDSCMEANMSNLQGTYYPDWYTALEEYVLYTPCQRIRFILKKHKFDPEHQWMQALFVIDICALLKASPQPGITPEFHKWKRELACPE